MSTLALTRKCSDNSYTIAQHCDIVELGQMVSSNSFIIYIKQCKTR